MTATTIVFGALAPPLHKQLRVSPGLLAEEQRNANAITRLRIVGLLTEAESHRARGRLVKAIARKRRREK